MALSIVKWGSQGSEWAQTGLIDIQEDWELVNRFAKLFNRNVLAEDFSIVCQQTLQLAVQACKEGRWILLKNASEDLKKLSSCWKTSLLNYAVAQKKDKWAEQLIQNMIDIHSTDFNGHTPLHTAAKRGACHLIKPLLKHIKIDAEDKKKRTPLFVAIESGQKEFVRALIQEGAHINGRIPMDEDNQFALDALGFAVMRGEISSIDELIKSQKCQLNCAYRNLGGLLHIAIYSHQLSALEHLLKHYKSQLNIEFKDDCSNFLTPLSFAASLGEQEAISLLYRYGASIDAKDLDNRLPIHHAAMGCHHDTIQLLASLGSKIDTADINGDRPRDLVPKIPGEMAQSCANLLINLSKNKEARKLSPTEQLSKPSNLVFRGGGAKGLAFVGALGELDEEGVLQNLKRVAGTSAGAITAALVALNYPINELEEILKEIDLAELLLDHPLSKGRLEEAFAEATDSTTSALKTLSAVLSTCLIPSKLIITSLQALYKCTGICDGEKFRKWLEDLIKKQTGVPFFTLGELAQRIKNGEPYKHLHVFALKKGKDSQIVHISSEDPQWANLIVSDVVRASMSIPGVFKPHILHIKDQGKRIPEPDLGSFLDGGMIYNFPIETFDRKQFFTRESLGNEGNCQKYNKQTIGLSLYSSLNTAVDSSKINTIKDLLLGICNIYLGAEESIRELNPYNASRVIEIDVKDVGTLSFNLSSSKKEELLRSGREATKTFLESHRLTKFPGAGEKVRTIAVPVREIGSVPGVYVFATCAADGCSNYQVGKWIRYEHRLNEPSDIEQSYGPRGVKCLCCQSEFKKEEIADKLAFRECDYSLEYGMSEANGGKVVHKTVNIPKNQAEIFEWDDEALDFLGFTISKIT